MPPNQFQSSADCHDAQLSLRDVMTVTGSGDRLINGQNDLWLYKPATLYIINPAVIAHTPALSRLQHSAHRHNRMFSCHFRIHLHCIDTQQCNTQFSVWCRARSPHPVRLRSLTHLNWARGRKVQFRWESARVSKSKNFLQTESS